MTIKIKIEKLYININISNLLLRCHFNNIIYIYIYTCYYACVYTVLNSILFLHFNIFVINIIDTT